MTPNPVASARQAAQQHRAIISQDQLDSATGRAMHRVGVAPASRSLLWRHKGKFTLGGGAAVGGTAYLYRHHKNGSKTVAKSLNNPFGSTELVLKSVSPRFGARNAFTSQPTQVSTVLRPAGVHHDHASHANKLQVFHGKHLGNLPRRTQLVKVGKK